MLGRFKTSQKTYMAIDDRRLKPCVIKLLAAAAGNTERTKALVNQYIRFCDGIPRGEPFVLATVSDDYGPENMKFVLKDPDIVVRISPSLERRFHMEIESRYDKETREMYGQMFADILCQELDPAGNPIPFGDGR